MSERVVVQNASYGGEECKGLAFKKDPCNKTPCPGKFFINLNFYYLFHILIQKNVSQNEGNKSI